MTVGRLLRAIVSGKGHNGVIGIVAGTLALVALVVGSTAGNVGVHAHLRGLLVASCCAAAIVVFGVIATTRISAAVGHLAFLRTVPSAGVAVRIFVSGVGYLICAFAVLAVLNVGVGKLLVGAGLAGVVLGIAAQPSLGNVFAGIVLVVAHPFTIGDRVRIRSGALGGIFDAAVMDLGLAYVTLQTDDGVLRIPNSAMLAAGVLQLNPDSAPLPPTTVVAAPVAPGAAAGAGGGAHPWGAGAAGPLDED